jgi:formylglycine-generating enzyme required for sulfatase activity
MKSSARGKRATIAALGAAALLYGAPRFAAALESPAPAPPAQAAGALPVETVTLPNTLVKWEEVQIPAGTVEIADQEKPGQKKTVQVKKLWMSKTEVLWDLYDVYAFRLDQTEDEKAKNVDAESRPSKPYGAPDRGYGHQGYAALSMHWNAAENFVKWLSKKTGKKYRIPTEAEWEYAARAGATSVPTFTDEMLEPIAWYWENADDKTMPAGKKKPNAWGFVDLLGNASEWVQISEGKYALAGGSFLDKAKDVQPGARKFYKPEWQAQDAHTPKSKWWLSDGAFAGMRIVREE